MSSERFLEGGETCYWDGHCSILYQTKRSWEQADGELIVTSKRITFMSPTRTFSFAPWKILVIDRRWKRKDALNGR